MLSSNVTTTIAPSELVATRPSTETGLEISWANHSRHRLLVPGLVLSLFVTGGSALFEPRRALYGESSVTLSTRRPKRRPISLAEARARALETLRRAEDRWERFAAAEAESFRFLYGNLT